MTGRTMDERAQRSGGRAEEQATLPSHGWSPAERRLPALLAFLLLAAAPLEGAEVRAYRAARIVRAPGDAVAPGLLIVRDGEVEDVLEGDAAPPEGAEFVDLGEAVVLPGLVDPLSAITGGSSRRSSRRASQRSGSPSDSRRALGWSRIRLDDPVYRRLGRTGYTALAIVPGNASGLIAGQASVIRPASGSEKEPRDLVVLESSYLLIGFDTGKNWADAARNTIHKAAEEIVKKREKERKDAEAAKKEEKGKDTKEAEAPKEGPKDGGGTPPRPAPAPANGAASGGKSGQDAKAPAEPPPPDPLVEVLEGERAAFVRLGTPAAIDHFFAFLDTLPLSLEFVLVTGPQPPEVVRRLARERNRIRAVVLEPRMGRLWETSIYVNTARLFLEKGFDVAFVPAEDSIDGHREVFFHLAEMVKSGVFESEALAGLTTVPARLIGLEGKAGVLRKGAVASFVVYDREPLAGNARILSVVVAGTRVFEDDLESGAVSGEAVR